MTAASCTLGETATAIMPAWMYEQLYTLKNVVTLGGKACCNPHNKYQKLQPEATEQY
jgi:hypothetical protein